MADVEASISEWIKLSSEALGLLRALYPLLPTQNHGEVEAKLEAAELALRKADVALAQAWGFKLHDCTFPPQIMLWDEETKSRVCKHCGHRLTYNRAPDEEDDFLSVRR